MPMTMNQDLANFQSAAPAAVVCDASDWGVLAVGGADATAFLQGQLSSDVAGLAEGAGQWTSYNSPKGRMLANGWLWRTPGGDGYRWGVAADLAAATAKRLAMFVLRSKVAVADLTPATARIGVGGPAARAAVEAALGEAPEPGRAIVRDGADVTSLPDGRVFVVAPGDAAQATFERFAAFAARGDAHAWRRFAIRAGTGIVDAATRELLLPQAANQDVLGAVALNPQKGCFPGQEVIKRMQALGQLKERLYAFRVEGDAPAHGARVFGTTFGDQACGTVLSAAPAEGGGADLLAVVQLAAANDALRLDAPDGRALAPRPLPYPVPAAEARARPASPV